MCAPCFPNVTNCARPSAVSSKTCPALTRAEELKNREPRNARAVRAIIGALIRTGAENCTEVGLKAGGPREGHPPQRGPKINTKLPQQPPRVHRRMATQGVFERPCRGLFPYFGVPCLGGVKIVIFLRCGEGQVGLGNLELCPP